MTTHPEGLTRPSEKSLELADAWVKKTFRPDDGAGNGLLPVMQRWVTQAIAELIDEREAEARKDGLKRAAEIADGKQMVNPSPIGPLHGAGWNSAATHIRTAILMEAGEKK